MEPTPTVDVLKIILAFVFVALNAFFVAAEFALVKIRVTRLEVLAKTGTPLAKMALGMVAKLDPYLSATQLGITLASLGLGWVGEPAFAHLIESYLSRVGLEWSMVTIHSIAFTIAFLLISALHIILGELVPKSIAIGSPEKVCLVIAVPMRAFYLTFFPFLWILNRASNFILRLMKFEPVGGPTHAVSEEEIKLIVEDSFEEGVIEPRKRALLDQAIDFSHKKVTEVMVPVDKMACFYVNHPLHENLERAKEAGYTRFPLFEKEDGELLGYVHMKDVIFNLENHEVINLFDLCRPVIYFFPETRLDHALRSYQRKAVHLGIVRSVDGKILGLITLENVIEQLVGAIEDEFDQDPEGM